MRLDAQVRWRGRVIDSLQWRSGRSVTIKAGGLPGQDGADFVARLDWDGASGLTGTDNQGRTVAVGVGKPAEVSLGEVSLALDVSSGQWLQRLRWPTLAGSLGWFTIVVGLFVFGMQANVLIENRCGIGLATLPSDWFVRVMPGCVEDQGARSGGVSAEFLQRLLRDEYDGADQGYMIEDMNRPEITREAKHIYMPAGNEGPTDRMGGAAEVAAEPIRTPDEAAATLAEAVTPVPSPTEGPEVAVVETPRAPEGNDGSSDGEAEKDVAPPAEEERGWGVKDWYDQGDEAIDQLEIRMMLREAKARLRIDPDDPAALSLLSYYQYLAEDYEAAMDTWDRYIGVLPEDAAGYNNKALIYKRRASYDEEERLYRVALALAPDDVTALNNLAVCLAHLERFDEAIAILEQLEVLDPDDAYANLHRAKVYAAKGEPEVAMRWLERSLTGMSELDTLHHIEYRQDIRLDPAFSNLRKRADFNRMLAQFYGPDSPTLP